jgi:hypothetical protein
VLPACLCALKSTVGSLFAGAARKAFCSGSTEVEPACLCALKSTEGSFFAGWLCHPEKKGREKGRCNKNRAYAVVKTNFSFGIIFFIYVIKNLKFKSNNHIYNLYKCINIYLAVSNRLYQEYLKPN